MTDQALSQLCDQVRELLPRVTPGPWEAEAQVGKGAWIKGANGDWAALSCGDTAQQGADHAALIALAPTMAAALLKLREELRSYETTGAAAGKMLAAFMTQRDVAEAKLAEIAPYAEELKRSLANDLRRSGLFDLTNALQRIHAIATSGRGQ